MRRFGRRLYHEVWLAFVAVAAACVVVAGLTARLLHPDDGLPPQVSAAAAYLAEDIPHAAPGPAVAALSARLGVDLRLWDAEGNVLATAGEPLPSPRRDGPESQWLRGRWPAVAARLPDGRWLAAGMTTRRHSTRFLLVLAALVAATALGVYPVARRITRRLEGLQRGVEEWGAGDLARRVPVCGRDEVARLAESFNRAAERIERLVDGQRRVLASASHELRSPLARLRMAVEMLDGDAALKAGAERDVAELDELVGDLLLASRVRATGRVERAERVDLLALVAEEAGRVGVAVDGAPTEVAGDARMLRRLLRNLLENARRHGGGDVSVTLGPGARVAVEDRGPGVPEAERERIFEPFYRPAGHREGEDGGVGLGLALVREIAVHHGGEAWVEPRDGGGSRFVVRLGACDDEPFPGGPHAP